MSSWSPCRWTSIAITHPNSRSSREECLTLLSGQSVGRIAVVADDGLPFVVPVNYELVGDTIVFRTNAGTKLDALHRHPVAFQIDSIDPAHRAGWSVLVQGVAHDAAPHELTSVSVEPWLGSKQHWIQVVPRYISGRRIRTVIGMEMNELQSRAR